MKLLLDENLSRRLVPFLQHDYPGSSQVVLLGLESASDQAVRLDTPNQSRAATLKLLLESRLLIEDVLEAQGFASIEISQSKSSG